MATVMTTTLPLALAAPLALASVVVADAVTVGIHVTPPGDGLRGRVRCHDSLSRGQVSHAKRKSRNGKDGAQSRCHNRDHFPLH